MTASEYRPYVAARIHRLLLGFAVVAWAAWMGTTAIAGSPETSATRYPITIDATSIVPQSWWQVPGITPSIWYSAPETSEPRVLRLQPGRYKFISFTFDFPFEITAEGTVAYPSSLNQCVEGRGTPILTVRCKRTYPHGGQPEYSQIP
jgi:hypothetical protein